MPTTTTILSVHDLMHICFSGRVLLHEVRTEMRRAIAAPDYRAGMNEIGDLRNVKQIDIDFFEMRVFARKRLARLEGLGTRTTLCLLAGNGLGFGMARMFQTLVDAPGGRLAVHVLTDPREVEAILGLPPLTIPD